MTPEPPPKQKLFFPRFGSKFRYSGKTHYQTRMSSALIDRPPLNFQRTLSNRRLTTRSMDGGMTTPFNFSIFVLLNSLFHFLFC